MKRQQRDSYILVHCQNQIQAYHVEVHVKIGLDQTQSIYAG